jgi:predicted aspartyl protease
MIGAMRSLPALLPIAIIAIGASSGSAQIYRWVDEKGIVHYSEGVDSVPHRLRGTAARLPYQRVPAETITVGAGGETIIEFTPGAPIFLTARVNGTADARLILDTGADRTVIAPRALARAGVIPGPAVAQGRIRSATGAADVNAYDIESLRVGNATVTRLQVISHDIDVPEADGLLGRDFLERFKVTLDGAAGRVVLGSK